MALVTVDTGTVSASSFCVMIVVPTVVVLGAAINSTIVQVALPSEPGSPHCTPTLIVAKVRSAVSVSETCDAFSTTVSKVHILVLLPHQINIYLTLEPVKGTSPIATVEPELDPVVIVVTSVVGSVTYETTNVVPSVPTPMTSPPRETPSIGAMEVGSKIVTFWTCA